MDKQLTINYVDVVIKHSLADIIAEANNKYEKNRHASVYFVLFINHVVQMFYIQ